MYLVSLQGHLTSASPSASGCPTECTAGTKSASSSSIRSQHVGAHPGHHAHRGGDVGRVGDLDAEHRLLGLEVAHHERDDVHRAAGHAALVEAAHERLHLGRVHPVVGGPAVLLVDRADVGAVLDPRHVDRVGGGVERVRLDVRVELDERAGRDERLGQLGPLLVGAGAPVDAVRRGHRGDLVDEVEDALVGRRAARRRGGSVLGGGHAWVLSRIRGTVGSLGSRGVVVGTRSPSRRRALGVPGPRDQARLPARKAGAYWNDQRAMSQITPENRQGPELSVRFVD